MKVFWYSGSDLISRKICSPLYNSFSANGVHSFELQSARKIWTSGPLCMGRRSSKIAGRKGAQDAKKAKLYSRIGKEVISAVKKGGPSLVSNKALADLLEKFKELDVPKEIFERNVKKASEKGQEAYIEKVYEVYGYGGAGIIVEVLTDKVNRSVALVREVVRDCGGKMADPGSIMFKFRRARVVNIKAKNADKDQLLAVALDAGADDVIEPPIDEEDNEEDLSERYYKIVTSTENYTAILSKLREEGVNFEPDNGSELLPLTTVETEKRADTYCHTGLLHNQFIVEALVILRGIAKMEKVDDEAEDLNKDLMAKLLELDDVEAVYTDQK
uniref:Uncharacterized protein n=1 Tax=Daucus carota subsp. sativus TaxID=79200 RepID=A0A162BA02_DAUCS